jgi:hypothetical protein
MNEFFIDTANSVRGFTLEYTSGWRDFAVFSTYFTLPPTSGCGSGADCKLQLQT